MLSVYTLTLQKAQAKTVKSSLATKETAYVHVYTVKYVCTRVFHVYMHVLGVSTFFLDNDGMIALV